MSDDYFLNLQPGSIVNGRYEVVKCLGTGSMGMVYACRHRELAGHLVAMKVLFSEVARDSVAAQRFRNEIVASYGVSHPNVVRAYEYFRDGDLVAFTMEYIGGGDLADRIASEKQLPIDEVIRILSQMCSGVEAIHQAGIVHRDLKPENILITAQGDVKITDFGIARCGTGPKLTEHGGVVGTIDYVSPEYLESGEVDARSDLYAIGVIGYEILTGETPFRGESVIETMTLRLRSDVPSARKLRKDCPLKLDSIISKAMARDPGDRYQTAHDMFLDLQALLPDDVKLLDLQPKQSSPMEPITLPLSEGRDGVVASHNKTLRRRGREDRPSSEKRVDLNRVSKSTSADAINRNSPATYEFPREKAALSVNIGSSHLSADRVKELSSRLYSEKESIIKTAIYWLFVVLLGFGLGILGLRYYEPELFGQAPRTAVPSYRGIK
ncbi:MAG: serine/threonine protein kinase [Deltaproteobacteria bacterium]|nr:serine/threonine protein kinase [Deltaproteobacteria bacterium]